MRAIHLRLCSLMIGLGAAGAGHAQSQLWVTQFGSRSEDFSYSAAADGGGGVFIGGHTLGDIAGSLGSADCWLARYDGFGAQLWIQQFGTSKYDVGSALAVDGTGGVFVGGFTIEESAFLRRYDHTGALVWARGAGARSYVWGLGADGSGGAFVAGGTLLSLGGPQQGNSDALLARYDADGNRLWITQSGTPAVDAWLSAVPDEQGGVIVSGITGGDLAGPSAGEDDAILARYNVAGNLLWVRQFGSSGIDDKVRAASDGKGGVFVAGNTTGTLGGTLSGSQDAWLARFDGDGNPLWITQFGSNESTGVIAVASDDAGGVLLGGYVVGELAGPATGRWDAWFARYNSDGERIWILQLNQAASAHALLADGEGGFFVTGETGDSLGAPHLGGFDVWLARYTDAPCPADCDGSGVLDFADFLCFQNLFAAGDPGADCDRSQVLDVFDFLCFQNQFATGCP